MPDSSSSVSAYLEASVPRITQYALEVLANPSNTEPRITQYALEVLDTASNVEPRITQYALEVLVKPDSTSNVSAYLEGSDPHPRLTQVAVETLVNPSNRSTRLTQVAAEALLQPDTRSTRLTQVVVEVLIKPLNNIPAYLSGAGNVTDSLPAYLAGNLSSSSTTPAFLSGVSTLQTDSQSAYTYGQATATDAQPAFAEGFQDQLSESTPAYIYGAGEIIYPDGDISQSGSWKREDESTSNLYVSIDEQPGYNDSDYVYHGSPIATDYFEVTLSDPQYISVTAGEVRVFWRASRISGTATTTIKVELRENTTVIASDTQTVTDSYQTFDFTLTQGERDNITDWTDLRLRFIVESIS